MSPTRVPETPIFLGGGIATFELVLTCRKIPRSEVKSFWTSFKRGWDYSFNWICPGKIVNDWYTAWDRACSPLFVSRERNNLRRARKAFFFWGQQINSYIFYGNRKESRNRWSSNGRWHLCWDYTVGQTKDDTDGHRPGIRKRSTSYINVCRFPANEKWLRSKVWSIQWLA